MNPADRTPADLNSADRIARRRLVDALLIAAHEPADRGEERIAATLAAFDRAFPPPETAAAGGRGPRRRGRRRAWPAALATAALLAAVAAGVTLPAPPDAAAAVERLADAAAADGPRRYTMRLTFADGTTVAGTLAVAGRERFRVDLDPARPRGGGLRFGSDGAGSWISGPRGRVRTFDRPAVWRRDPAAADYRVLPGPPAELLDALGRGYALTHGDPGPDGVRTIRAERNSGAGPDRVLLRPDAAGRRTLRMRLEWNPDRPTRVRSVELIDAGAAPPGAADPPRGSSA